MSTPKYHCFSDNVINTTNEKGGAYFGTNPYIRIKPKNTTTHKEYLVVFVTV